MGWCVGSVGHGLRLSRTRCRGSNHGRQCRSPSTVCDSSAMMRNRALVVRSISASRRRGRSPMEECAASLRRRSSTQVSAHPSTARIMLMSSCRVPSSLIRSASRAAVGAPRLETGHTGGNNPHREVPAWCSQQDLCGCTVAHCFALLRGRIWLEPDGPSAWSVNSSVCR